MNMRVERRIVVAGTLIVLVMALVAAIPWVMNVQLEAAFGALADVAARERAYESLLDTFAAIDHDRRAYLLTSRAVFLQSPAAALAALAPIRQRLRAGAHDADERTTLRAIERDLDAELADPRRDGARVARLQDRIDAEIARERAERTRWHERVMRDSRFASRSAIAAAVAEALILAAALRATGRAMLALRRAADEAEERGRLLHRLQCASGLDETPALLGAALPVMYPNISGAFYLRRVGHDRLERHAAWGNAAWPAQLATTQAPGPLAGDDVPAPSYCLPLLAQGALIGALCLGIRAPAAGGFALLGEQVALALANIELRERLRHESLVDPLTQLYNRRFLVDAFERELERAARAQSSVSIALIDLDHFKQINDVHGHDTGDAVLAMVGTLLREAVRGADVACRYGGEEMLVVLPGCGFGDALERAEELRGRIARLAVAARDGKRVGISASFGVASYPEHGTTPAQLMAAADAALYAAKRDGRDRVAGAGQLHTFNVSNLVR
jgi:diguanylate cyclase (GGDEF)-like protein